MKRKLWTLSFIVSAIMLFAIIFVNTEDNVYSKENCLEPYIPCVNAFTDEHTVKVFNGTSSLDSGDGSFVYGDFFEKNVERAEVDVLIAEQNEVVTLEYINNKPLNISVFQLDGEEREQEIKMTQNTFTAPNQPGTYIYELYAEYSNGNVHHYLKIKVK